MSISKEIWDWFCSGYGGYTNGGAAKQPNTGNIFNVNFTVYYYSVYTTKLK